MDWANERYVRLYTRDTLTMRRLGYHGRALLCELLRKVDRAGVLDIGAEDPMEAVAFICDVPLEFVNIGLPLLLKLEIVEHLPTALEITNFEVAQEAAMSDPQRKRESRARRRDKARLVTLRDVESQIRTTGHESGQNVTRGHTRSQAVTPSCAVPSLAVPKEENAKHPTVILENTRKDIFDVWLEDVIIPAYPEHRRGSGLNAARAWLRAHRPDEHLRGVILASVKEWSESAQWQAKEGNFVPGLGAFFENLTWNSHPKKKAKAEARFVG
jgi:hypothetical protein